MNRQQCRKGRKMRVRIKFSKHGVMKFIGHLDIMRYFQKAIRRAGIDIAYSGGFSPHQIMSFAAPLGVGHYSNGEYLDIEINSHTGQQRMIDSLNDSMADGIRILAIVALPDTAENAMASVAAAGYTIRWKEGYPPLPDLEKTVADFFNRDTIWATKQTKKSEITLDLKPGIYEIKATADSLYLLLDASSRGNIKPALFLEALYLFAEKELDPMAIQITREETYTNIGSGDKPKLVPLEAVGESF